MLGVLVIGEVLMTIHKAREEQHETARLNRVILKKIGLAVLGKKTGHDALYRHFCYDRNRHWRRFRDWLNYGCHPGYTAGKRRHQARKTPDETAFGQGAPQGVAATEAANSAVSGANLIPVLSLGIPGNAAAVFLILAMESIDGINPGPGVFKVPSEANRDDHE